MIFDLHSHTDASDGELEPRALIERARANGVSCLSITDHDTVDGYIGIDRDTLDGLTIIRGIELSAQWHGRSIHIVGLNIDLAAEGFPDALAAQRNVRLERAKTIARRLKQKGIDGALDGARNLARSDNVGRPHFAKFLVATGKVRDEQQAFKRFLGKGKVGDVQQLWPAIDTVTAWIRDAGGTPVLAHPAHYKMTNTKLAILVEDFCAAGGKAMEVVSGRQSAELTSKLADLSVATGLLASTGSDFHRVGKQWSDIGKQSALPGHLKPVWDAW
jgi:predicted metal-dependent phosphoesterase TrpH